MSAELLLMILKDRFGLPAFREGQQAIIEAVLSGVDTVAVMPTGGGKSLCFQLPALVLPGVTVVVSPLIALMKDQVDGLVAKGIEAACLNSTLSPEEQGRVLSAAQRGAIKLLYIAPERFRSRRFVETLASVQVSLLAVDEAHCVSQWGHDFRPDYLRLGEGRQWLGDPVCLALTATATPDVRADIVGSLNLRTPRIFFTGIDRPNLVLSVSHPRNQEEKYTHIRELMRSFPGGAGIIYASTRKNVDKVWMELRRMGLPALRYHAGLGQEERARTQDVFMGGEGALIVATNAFGMGVDKPDIRFVIHYDFPGSLEAYYQEVGRAGRDGKPSHCVTLFNYADRYIQEYFVEGSNPGRKLIEAVYHFLVKQGEEVELTIPEITRQVGSTDNEMAVGTALQILDRFGAVERGGSWENQASVQLEEPVETLLRLLARAPAQRAVVQALGEMVGEAELRLGARLDLDRLARRLGGDRDKAVRVLHELDRAGLLHYTPPFRGRSTHLGGQGLERVDWGALAEKERRDRQRIQTVVEFAYGTGCRKSFLRRYFGMPTPPGERCGSCDVCLGFGSQPRSERSSAGARTRGRSQSVKQQRLPAAEPSSSGLRRVGRAAASPAAGSAAPPAASLPRSGRAPAAPSAELIDALKRWRMEKARVEGVRPFHILHNTVLEEIASLQPTTFGQLLAIKGIGKLKLAALGEEIIEVVQQHLDSGGADA